jgi:release factor glutamine methyltransferase
VATAGRSVPATDPSAASLLASATSRLAASPSETPRLDAEILVSHAFGRDRTWLLAHPQESLDAARAAELDAWVARRCVGEPVAYIRGFKEWFGLRVAADPRALIPRPETEQLAEAAIAEIAGRLAADSRRIVAWDVATGSGAVALAVALRFRAALALRRVRLVASDVAPDALELASENLAAHRVSSLVTLALGDLLEDAGPGPGADAGAGAGADAAPRADDGGQLPRPDLVTANLPYLTSAEVAEAPGSIAFEPRAALDGGADGLDLLRRLVSQLPERLARGGVALLEIGAGQGHALRAAAEALPIPVAVTLSPDLAGIDRVMRIARLD